MARPRKITAEQILEAAQAIFLEKGFGASTVDIANKAGISEGSIFKRFPTKEDLFIAAMGMSQISSWISFLESSVGKGELKENLKDLGSKMIEFFKELVPKMMMVRSKGLPIPPMLRQPDKAPPVRVLRALTSFFEEEIALGRIRPNNPQIIATMFMGSLMEFVILSQASAPLPDVDSYVNSVVDLLWTSIKPEEE
ncbi:MAG: TetR/AcrR family transcriptional regulator [Phormidesmis sp.]